ncbi:MAG: DUF6531 domain-containing protein, partial [Pirellulaceae bacterium]
MMPAAKHFDPVLGVDIHIIQPPGPVPPVPIPHPFIGFVIDPFDYAPFIGSTVKINYMHRALAGTAGKCVPPHIPIGGVFVKPPANECEIFMGSATVCVDGDAQSYLALPALSCHDVGMVPPPRANPKKKSKVKSMVLPTSVVLPIPAGPPVLIGGPPTISLMALGMRVGMAALGKLFKKLAKTKLFKRWKAKVKGKFKSKRKPGHHKSCGRPGEPVDVWSGANVDDFLDYGIPGPIPFEWKRYYDSALRGQDGPLGRGFRHTYQRELRRTPDGFAYVTAEGELVEFDAFPPDQRRSAQDGLLLTCGDDGIHRIAEAGAPTMEFHLSSGLGRAPLAALAQGPHRITFQYDSLGRLESIRGSQGEYFRLRYDANHHLRELTMSGASQAPTTLATYEFDTAGNLVTWTDAAGHSARYAYDEPGRMRKKTDRNGYTYRYAYDESGRCIHTWGEDGMYDVRLEYFPEALLTIATYADGAAFTYVFDEQGTLVEIIDPMGGSTQFLPDEQGRVTAEVDPAGNVTQFLYDGWGGHTARLTPTGHVLPPMHVQPHDPDVLAYELPRQPMQWEHGDLLSNHRWRALTEHDPVLRRCPTPLTTADLPGLDSAPAMTPRKVQDRMGRVVEQTDAWGRTERWQYDRNGNLVAYHDPDGAIHGRRIASWNLVRQLVDPLGNATTIEYSLREQVTKVVDENTTTSEFTYDGCDRLTHVVRHGELRERYEYDSGGNLLRKLDGLGQPLLTLQPGPCGLPAACELASGDKQLFQYDPQGRIVAAISPGAQVALSYDWAGRVSSDLCNERGVQHEVAPTQGRTTTVLNKFVTVQRLVRLGEYTIQDPTGRQHRFRASPAGLVSRQLSNGTTEIARYTPDGSCQCKLVAHADRPAVRWLRSYKYSPAGDLLEIEDNQYGARRYFYDAAHRLIGETLPDGDQNQFVYDRANNLLAQPGLSGVELASGNRLRAANGCEIEYDRRHHVSARHHPSGEDERYTYDSLDRLTSIRRGEEEWTADYDALGRRIRKRWRNHTVEFVWDDDRLAAEIHDGQRVRIYVYANIAAWVPFLFIDYDHIEAPPESGRPYFVFHNAI